MRRWSSWVVIPPPVDVTGVVDLVAEDVDGLMGDGAGYGELAP
ncbi:MAG: hypothetical protein ACREYC_00785 [Gammaproteobacteria bacterium]